VAVTAKLLEVRRTVNSAPCILFTCVFVKDLSSAIQLTNMRYPISQRKPRQLVELHRLFTCVVRK